MGDDRKPYDSIEIEITDEMIAAGVEEFHEVDLRFQTAESAVLDIFRAMLSRQTRVSERVTR